MTPTPSPPPAPAASLRDAAPDARAALDVLQVGMSWLPEQAGNGLDRVFHALAQGLPGEGVRVRGLVAGSDRVARESGGAVRAFAAPTDGLVRRLVAVRRAAGEAVAERRPDLLATHFALYAAPVVGLVRDVPHVVHFHGPWAAESAVEGASPVAVRLKAALERTVYGRGDRFVVLSAAFRDVLCEGYGVDPARVRVVPGGADLNRFATALSRAEARAQMGWPADRPVVLAVRRLARRMGLDRLIDAVALVRERVPDVLVVIAGRGPEGDALAAQVRALGLDDHVRFAGYVAEGDLPAAYRAADLSVVPTVALEGFGLTTVESLAAGTPVLVTPYGGLPEVVADLDAALVLADSTPREIADGIAGALIGTRPVPGRAACEAYARARFGWDRVARDVRAVYDEALA